LSLIINSWLTATKSLAPLAAALLNSSFIQGFELDDYHSDAPIHSSSVIVPALFAAAEQEYNKPDSARVFDGRSFLLAAIVGYEVGPRVGRGLWGPDMLALGWHSGAVFGPPAAAAAVTKLWGLDKIMIEEAMGTACTQACGLSSVRYESMVKRIQHGFAARNGLLAAYMTRAGVRGIKKVFEREHGGFLTVFSLGSKRSPRYKEEEVCAELGSRWEVSKTSVKPYPAMAGTHGTIDCVRALQKEFPSQMKEPKKMKSILIEMAHAAFKHGGWKPQRPATATGAQMSASYVAALQIVEWELLPRQFSAEVLNRSEVWDVIEKIECRAAEEFDMKWAQRITIVMENNSTISLTVDSPRGVDPEMSNEDIVTKWRENMAGVIDEERRVAIEKVVLGLDNVEDVVGELRSLLRPKTQSFIS
jgi:aconitate decarboxylase